MAVLQKRMPLVLSLAIVTMVALAAPHAQAVTLSDITSALNTNADAVNDLSANMAVDADDNNWDFTSAWIKIKDQSTAGTGKFRIHGSQPNNCDVYCDGTNVKVVGDGSQYTRSAWVTTNHLGWMSRMMRDCDMRWVLANNTFSLAEGTYSVNGVTCYLIASTNFDVYVNSAQLAQPVRIDAKESGNVKRRYTMSNYTYVESTAYAAASVVATDSPGDNTVTYSITYSNFSINDGLSDSYFTLP